MFKKSPKSAATVDFCGGFYYDYYHNDCINNSRNDYRQAPEANYGSRQ
jgi:hypothetical protein